MRARSTLSYAVIPSVLALLASPPSARAEPAAAAGGYFELAAGGAFPAAGTYYREDYFKSATAAVRAGVFVRPGLAGELSLSGTPYRHTTYDAVWIDNDVYRLLAGVRAFTLRRGAFEASARLALGVALSSIDYRYDDPFGNATLASGHETNVGLAGELGGAVALRLSPVRVGLALDLPIAVFAESSRTPQRSLDLAATLFVQRWY